jgi:C-1 hydroxylase
MGIVESREIVRRRFELLNAGDVTGASALWAPESRNHGQPVHPETMAKVDASLRSVHERHTLHEMIAEGEWVAVRTTCEGVHDAAPELPVDGGIFVGLPPTGRPSSAQHLHLFRVAEGTIREHGPSREDLGAARQIGRTLGLPRT